MDIETELRQLVDGALNLGGRAMGFEASTPLLGAIPELDSMGVVSIITALEERMGLTIDDDDIDGEAFRTWGSLVGFVLAKRGS